tara:strand:- start:554 stop:1276 length:723 start_codon:yes stop_codon:yes gene_type:complete
MESSKIIKIIFILLFFSITHGDNQNLQVGENLRYNVSFSGISAGEGTLKIISKEKINGKTTYRVQFTARTTGLINRLFPIDDTIDIWLSENQLFPIRIHSIINEGNYHNTRQTDFYQKLGYSIINKDTVTIEHGTHSPYSLFYFFRNKTLTDMDGLIFNTLEGKRTTSLQLNVEKNVQVIVPAGKYLCSKLTPSRINKQKFKNDASMSIWFSNDIYKYPVKIRLKLKYGAMMLELDKIIN